MLSLFESQPYLLGNQKKIVISDLIVLCLLLKSLQELCSHLQQLLVLLKGKL